MQGANLAEVCHLVNALPPQNISGGKTAQAFSMAGAEHVSIVIAFGAQGVNVPGLMLGSEEDFDLLRVSAAKLSTPPRARTSVALDT